jgi:hypothetical protein
MAKWKKDQKKFSVSLFYNDRRGCMAIIPKPILEKLGEPSGIQFVISGKKIIVEAGE